jgi:hypothetical protein
MQELNCSGLVFGLDLETNAADEVRYLPIQPDQVFVPKKYVNSRALKHGPNDNSLGEIAISGYRYEITQFRLTIHFFEDGWLQARRANSARSAVCAGSVSSSYDCASFSNSPSSILRYPAAISSGSRSISSDRNKRRRSVSPNPRRSYRTAPEISPVLAAKVDGSSLPVAFPIELWHSPVGTQKGIRAVRMDWEQTAAIIVRFFEVKAEDMA